MFEILYPQIYVKSLLEIPLDKLKELKINTFILDLDNTITEWNRREVRQEIAEWFENIKGQGFKACILSNNGEQRVLVVARSLGIPYLHRAQKPRRRAFFQALSLMESQAAETAVIGDQIFTDVLGGNRAGLYTILVVPLDKREFPGTKISRCMEYFVLRRLRRKLVVGRRE
ncbi:MAG: YqeG family HAD IIIA-type phosphatase [Syntrophomonas sp.]|uniref:YqeG family HAD IIIA-type phosphatase n=1 Tax=Syntrophomonas sp. TaxID=2053627 RepID=UPI002601FF5C|nr:YqeG family HAD IIIA-type phosphatase [Syntrophomonas sp.]MDD2511373.1 YqeG family HAD IIIA-type phosphatase [Syntrophomonas sp.]MDD3880029.1 YqeG family HAD IIIA-type phosphatase [Syntrophomonas sp.]MDD4627501.1 YqeG family HAD IIIA-type phosphatase [Syntrophomonas sp.]